MLWIVVLQNNDAHIHSNLSIWEWWSTIIRPQTQGAVCTTSSSDAAVEAFFLGKWSGSVYKGPSVEAPWDASPRQYPRALPTGTATAFPTWMYL